MILVGRDKGRGEEEERVIDGGGTDADGDNGKHGVLGSRRGKGTLRKD